MNFKKFYLTEMSKPIGEKSKDLWFDSLSKYKNNSDDLYITFVSVDKVGINPNSSYSTPNGVYTYPLKWVLDGNQIPFRGNTKPKKVKVLKAVNDKKLTNELTDSEYIAKIDELEPLFDKMKSRNDEFAPNYNFKEFIKNCEKTSLIKTNTGNLWNVTRNLATSPNNWSKILLLLGFDYAVDNGVGYIHSNEKTQAVFLNPKSYKVIDEEFVDTEERYHLTQKIYNWQDISKILLDSSPDFFYKFLLNNKPMIIKIINQGNASTFLRIFFGRMCENFVGHMLFRMFDEYETVIEEFCNNMPLSYLSFLDNIPNRSLIEDVVTYFSKIFAKKILHMFSVGNTDILNYVKAEFVFDKFPEVFKELIDKNELDFLEDFNITTLKRIYGNYTDKLEKIFVENPKALPKNLYKLIEDIYS